MFDLDAFIARQIANSPIEARLVRKVVRALKAAGSPVVSVWDGEEDCPVKSEKDVLSLVFNLDQAWLKVESGAWVFLVLGNEWDVICDYSVSLEEPLEPVFAYIEKNDA